MVNPESERSLVESIIPIPQELPISPLELLRLAPFNEDGVFQCPRFPLDDEGYVPVIDYRNFPRKVMPIIEQLGDSAVRLSLPEQLLGFRSPSCRTPLVPGVDILLDESALTQGGMQWLVKVVTERDLTQAEKEVFEKGIHLLGSFAAPRLAFRRPLHEFFSKPHHPQDEH